jgi:DNA polymerase-3 subunit alpha
MDFDQPVLCKARISDYRGESQGGEEAQRQIKLLAREVDPLSQVRNASDETCHVPIRAENLRDEAMTRLKEILARYPGSNPVQLVVYMQDAVCRLQLGPGFCVRPGPDFWKEIQDWTEEAGRNSSSAREISPAHS